MRRKKILTMLVTTVTAATMLFTPQAAMAGTSQEEAKAQLDSARQQVEAASEAYKKAESDYYAAFSSATDANKEMLKAQKALADATGDDDLIGYSGNSGGIEYWLGEMNYVVPTKEEAQRITDESFAKREQLEQNVKNAKADYENVLTAIGKEFINRNSGESFSVDELAEYYISNSTKAVDREDFTNVLNTYLRIDNILYSANRLKDYNDLRKQNGLKEVKVSFDMLLTSIMRNSGAKIDHEGGKTIDGLVRDYQEIFYEDWQHGGDEDGDLQYPINISRYPGIENMTIPEIIIKYPKFLFYNKKNRDYLDPSYAYSSWAVTDSRDCPNSVQIQTFGDDNVVGATMSVDEYINAINAQMVARQNDLNAAKANTENAITLSVNYRTVNLTYILENYFQNRDGFDEVMNTVKNSNPSAKIKKLIDAVEKAEQKADAFVGRTVTTSDTAALEKTLQNAKAEYEEALATYTKAEQAYESYQTSIDNATVNIKQKVTYNGNAAKPTVEVIFNGKTLNPAYDYNVKYTNNYKIGTGNVIITGKGEYKDSVKTTFDIVPAKVKVKKLSKAKKAFKVSWAKSSANVTGYQITYSLKKNFSGAKIVTVKGKSKATKKISKLKKGKKYFVKVRAYSKVSGKTYASDWSAVKTVKTK